MQVFTDLSLWQSTRQAITSTSPIGFVPTMGNLHQGHAALFEKSLVDNELTVASIFVNPTQFNQEEDFKQYPNTLEEDLKLLTELGVHYCIVPTQQTMYPDDYRYQIDETKISKTLEGESRDGHFKGVLTVVMKLLNLVSPQRAYFGEKDFQQYQLIKEMVRAFFLSIDIIACPTTREPSGLAYSSRNSRLSHEEKKIAEQFAKIFHQPLAIDEIKNKLQKLGIEIDYVTEKNQRRYAAITIGNTRLIDNYAYL